MRLQIQKIFIWDRRGQIAVEYMLLLALAGLVVLLAMRSLLPRVEDSADRFYNKTAESIMGRPPDLP